MYESIYFNYYEYHMHISMDIKSFMSISRQGPLPDWEALYKTQKVETMPWYNENFDSDLEKELVIERLLITRIIKNSLTLQWSRHTGHIAC